VQVELLASIELSGGEISGSPIGACIGDRLFPLENIQGGVIYTGNGTNLDTIALPVPQSDRTENLSLEM